MQIFLVINTGRDRITIQVTLSWFDLESSFLKNVIRLLDVHYFLRAY